MYVPLNSPYNKKGFRKLRKKIKTNFNNFFPRIVLLMKIWENTAQLDRTQMAI